MRIIDSEDVLTEGLKALPRLDKRWRAIIKGCDRPPLRRREGGFAGLCAIIVSQQFHLDRALFIGREEGIEAWGLRARDVEAPYSIFTELRRYPSALRAYYDVWTDATAPQSAKVTIGVDPPG